jgi:Domain of unknown function (DUF4276)
MSVRLGMIVEASSDKAVIIHLLQKLTTKRFSTLAWESHGCGKLMAKCEAWARDLRNRGCHVLIVVQDRDAHSEPELRTILEARTNAAGFKKRVAVIPVREIEAWLIADPMAIAASFELKKAVADTPQPETHPDPKQRLYEVIRTASERRVKYVASIHNARIAKRLSIETVRANCPSFARLEDFANQAL